MPLDDHEVGSPEWEAEVERLDIEEQAERDGVAAAATEAKELADKEVEDKAAADAAAAAAAAAPKTEPVETTNAPAATTPAEPEKLEAPVGVTSKDGKTVLPYAALKGARKQAFDAKQQADQERAGREAAEARAATAEQLLADIKAGKVQADDAPSAKELEDLEKYAPKTAKAYREAVARAEVAEAAAVEARKAAPKPAAAPAAEPEDPAQEAIDQIPLLSGWQASDPAKFDRAVDHDMVLKKSPKWAGRSVLERFKHVTKLVADEYDIQMQDETTASPAPPPPTTPPKTSKADPKAVIAAAKPTAPHTLSDFKGGAVDQKDDLPLERMPAVAQLARVQDMTPAQFDSYLAKLGAGG